jgi:putative transposase
MSPKGADSGVPKHGGNIMPQSFASIHCHIVFSSKHRKPFISTEIQPRLYEYIGGLIRNHGRSLIAAGGMPDHIHLLISLGRTLSIADAVRIVKANSSGWIHDKLRMPAFAWQTGYGAFSVSVSNLDQVKSYIADQAEHHRRISYQDEFREFLRRHGIEWDERYAWD